jgi:hypothetical protein
VFSAMGVQKHNKKRFTKKIVSKSFYKQFDQKSKTDFFSICYIITFLAFLGEGSQKNTIKKIKKSDPSRFLASDQGAPKKKGNESDVYLANGH